MHILQHQHLQQQHSQQNQSSLQTQSQQQISSQAQQQVLHSSQPQSQQQQHHISGNAGIVNHHISNISNVVMENPNRSSLNVSNLQPYLHQIPQHATSNLQPVSQQHQSQQQLRSISSNQQVINSSPVKNFFTKCLFS